MMKQDSKVVLGDAHDVTGDDELQRQFSIQCHRPVYAQPDSAPHHWHEFVRRDQEALTGKVDGPSGLESAICASLAIWSDIEVGAPLESGPCSAGRGNLDRWFLRCHADRRTIPDRSALRR